MTSVGRRGAWLLVGIGAVLVASCDAVLGIQEYPAIGGDDGGIDGGVRGDSAFAVDATGGNATPDGGPDSGDGAGSADDAADSADASPVSTDPHRVVSISVGTGATACALTVDGLVYCWGDNNQGQVGDGTRTDRMQAAQVKNDSTGALFANIVEVSVGDMHVCARDVYRYFYCWGDDDFGQLGDGRYNTDAGTYDGGIGAVASTLPLKVGRGVAPVQIVAGGLHSCFVDNPLLDAGVNLECWGSNAAGELGHAPGTNGDVLANNGYQFDVNPNPGGCYPWPNDFFGVSLGTFMGCYLRPDHSTWCWGSNSSYLLGTPNGASSATPVEVGGSNNVGSLMGMQQVSSGGSLHVCARDPTPSGNVWCWGSNENGELGTGAPISSAPSSTVQVQVQNVRQVSVGPDDTCALVGALGQVACWGSNSNNQLGHVNLGDQTCTGTATPCDPTPSLVAGASDAGTPLSSVMQIGLGQYFACALKADSTVWCWGAGANGRLGNGSTSDSATPVQVLGLP